MTPSTCSLAVSAVGGRGERVDALVRGEVVHVALAAERRLGVGLALGEVRLLVFVTALGKHPLLLGDLTVYILFD